MVTNRVWIGTPCSEWLMCVPIYRGVRVCGYEKISKTRSVLQISSLKSGSGDSSKGSGRWSHHNKPGVDKKNPWPRTLKSVISNRFVWNLGLCE